MGKIRKVKTGSAAAIATSSSKPDAKHQQSGIESKKSLKTSFKPSPTAIKKDKGKLLFDKTIQPKKHSNKKDKMKQRKSNLMNKFALIKKQKKEEVAKKNREKTAVVGDMKPLKDALPSLDELFKMNRDEIKTGVQEFEENRSDKKLTRVAKMKKRKTEQLNRFQCFESLLKDPDYKKNAREAIAMHIKYTHSLVQ